MLLIAIAAYFGITLFAAFFLRSAAEFWFLAILVGMFQGGIQALSRSEFGKLGSQGARQRVLWLLRHLWQVRRHPRHVPRGHVHPRSPGNSSLGVLSIAVLFVVGFVTMLRVPERTEA